MYVGVYFWAGFFELEKKGRLEVLGFNEEFVRIGVFLGCVLFYRVYFYFFRVFMYFGKGVRVKLVES